MSIPGFASFSRANDLGNGLIAYPLMGIAAALLTLCAALSAILQKIAFSHAWPLYAAALLAILHSATTINDEGELNKILDRFAAWHNARTILQVLNFAMLVWGIVVLQ